MTENDIDNKPDPKPKTPVDANTGSKGPSGRPGGPVGSPKRPTPKKLPTK